MNRLTKWSILILVLAAVIPPALAVTFTVHLKNGEETLWDPIYRLEVYSPDWGANQFFTNGQTFQVNVPPPKNLKYRAWTGNDVSGPWNPLKVKNGDPDATLEYEYATVTVDLYNGDDRLGKELVETVEVGATENCIDSPYNPQGWGPVEPTTNGGNWGGIAPGTCCAVWYSNDGDANWASVDLDAEKDEMYVLKLRVLDGIADDSFTVKVNGNLVYTYLGKNNPAAGGYNKFGEPAGTNEVWYVHEFPVIAPANTMKVRITSTANQWASFNPYGQLGVDWIELYSMPSYLSVKDVGYYADGQVFHVPVNEKIFFNAWTGTSISSALMNTKFTAGANTLSYEFATVTFDFDLTGGSCTLKTSIDGLGNVLKGGTAHLPADTQITFRANLCGWLTGDFKKKFPAGDSTVMWEVKPKYITPP